MPKEFSRITRVAEVIRRELAVILQKEMKDPRVGMISVAEVQVTKDMAQAKVFISFIDEDPARVKETLKILTDAAGFLRTQVAQRVSLRTTPKFHFAFDNTLSRGNHISRLIERAMAEQS